MATSEIGTLYEELDALGVELTAEQKETLAARVNRRAIETERASREDARKVSDAELAAIAKFTFPERDIPADIDRESVYELFGGEYDDCMKCDRVGSVKNTIHTFVNECAICLIGGNKFIMVSGTVTSERPDTGGVLISEELVV